MNTKNKTNYVTPDSEELLLSMEACCLAGSLNKAGSNIIEEEEIELG